MRVHYAINKKGGLFLKSKGGSPSLRFGYPVFYGVKVCLMG